MCRQTEMRCGCSMCTGRAAYPSREPLASAPEPEARGDWHNQKSEVKIDLSRDSSGADGIRTDERDDPVTSLSAPRFPLRRCDPGALRSDFYPLTRTCWSHGAVTVVRPPECPQAVGPCSLKDSPFEPFARNGLTRTEWHNSCFFEADTLV